MMLQMTDVISNFHGNSHAILQNGSVPRCYKLHASSHFFAVFPMKITKTAQYHDATNSRFYLHVSWYFPCNSPKQLSTMMLQITDFYLHSSSYFPKKIIKTAQYHDATSDMRQRKFFRLFHMKFIKTAQYHNATHDMLYLNFFMVFPHEFSQNSSVP